ncbi:Myo-inositol 2-dehydrogenase [Phycisphaerales bacterium]|nr:Myo-inositol 2-dehydrogenase [Phycisphaerales bacterium]
MTPPVRIGVVGLGFMGQVHVKSISAARAAGLECVLAAVADHSPDRLNGQASVSGNLDAGERPQRLFDPAETQTFQDPAAMFSSAGLDAVVIATPTDTHEALTASALRSGLHVLLEKPVAIGVQEVSRLIEHERATRRHVMPAMCIRFWPGWTYLKECIDTGRFGGLHALRLTRLGSRPEWSAFYADESRSGGAIFDLHIHDSDFVLHSIGRPRRVLSVGTTTHLTTLYGFDDYRAVIAEGGWLASAGRGFRMRFCAEFDTATVEFDLANSPTVAVTSGGSTSHPLLPHASAYEAEMQSFLNCVAAWKAGSTNPPPATLADALAVTRLLLAERKSLTSGEWEPVNPA